MNELQEKVVAAFRAVGLDPALGCAIISHESDWNAEARSNVKAADEKYGGAWGLSQMLVPTARRLGYKGDGPGLWDVDTHLDLFIKLVQSNIRAVGMLTEDLVAMHNSGKPLHRAPKITQNVYVPRVMKQYALWQKILAL